jgi:hypothetical protein
MVAKLREALDVGRKREGESSETAGYRQAEAIMQMCHEQQATDDRATENVDSSRNR